MADRYSAGALKHKITIRRSTPIANGFNEAVESWADLIRVWAGKEDLNGSEGVRAQEITAQCNTRFIVRWSRTIATIDPRDRVSYKGREFNIVSVRDIGERRWRQIDAVARAESVVAESVPDTALLWAGDPILWNGDPLTWSP